MILTQGNRPAEVDRAVTSAVRQEGPPIEVLVIGNGCPLPQLSEQVKTLELPENLGIPGGRNRGVAETTGDVVLFLDDDGWYADPGLAHHVRQAFSADPTLGILSFRIVDPDTGTTARRHVPRLGVGDPRQSGDVTIHLGGACAVRRAVFDQCGPYPDAFWYAHEEIDLAWRALDHGWRIHYDANATMMHPATEPARHEMFWHLNARNRVWLARRRLPWPLAVTYVTNWVLITLLRARSLTTLRAWIRGLVEGLRTSGGPRQPIRWRTAWRMTKLGRPPII